MAQALSRHVKLLETSIAFLRALAAELRCTLCPVDRAFESLWRRQQFAELDFIEAALNRYRAGGSFRNAYALGLGQSKVLHKEDKEVLLPLGDVLGATDIDGQLSAIELAELLLGNALERARQRQLSHARLYITTGILAAAALAIIML